MNSQVWINGQLAGGQPYGYMSFELDITEFMQPGENVIAVRVDNSLEPSARWYHPCGIYAPVRLVILNPVHVAPHGVYIRTESISDKIAVISVETSLSDIPPPGIRLTTQIFDPQNQSLGIAVTHNVDAKQSAQSLSLPKPQRWDIHSPSLYTAQTKIMVNDLVVDTVETKFGLRTTRWDTKTGFWLNERNVKLKGVADHLEAGPVGGEAHASLIRWKIKLLKELSLIHI